MADRQGDRRKHALFLAFPFPPSRGAGVYRTVATANTLVGRGWRVTAVAPHEDYFYEYVGSEDRSLLDWVDPRVHVERVELRNWWLDTRVDTMPLLQALAPSRHEKVRRFLARSYSPLDHYPFWLSAATARAIRVARRDPVNILLATGNPFNSFVAAWLVGRLMKIPYLLDYRDAWTFDQFSGEIKPMASDVALALERRVLHGAAAVTAVNQPILDWLATTHAMPARVQRIAIENGFDPEFINEGDDVAVSHRGADEVGESGATFLYIGTVIPEKFDWAGLLRRWKQAQRMLPFTASLDIYGHLGFSSRQADQMESTFRSDGVRHHGSVPKADVYGLYAQADALVLPMYESPYVTSGKVYEMLATGKPILAIGPATAGAMVPVRGYPKLVRTSGDDPRELAAAVQSVIRLATLDAPQLDRASLEHARKYERAAQLRPLANLIEKLAR